MNTNKEQQWQKLADAATAKGGDGDEIVSAYKELYAVHTDKICSWLGGLYDRESGGFYYSNSARDNEYRQIGDVKHYFLPDIESTNQATNFLMSSNMLRSYDELPREMIEGVIRFTKSLQDPDDGYIYHPQWGKNIRDSRRGRDMMWAEAMEEKFNFKLPYKTATERLRELGSSKNNNTDTELPEYLRSKEAFKKYLESFDWDNKAYPAGNTIAAQMYQIEAAGLMPTAIDFLNSIQDQETGLWGVKRGYDAVNAILKITAVYNYAPMPNPEKLAMAALDCTKTDELAECVTYPYNAWYSVRNVLENLRKFSGEEGAALADGIVAEVLKRAPDGIRASAEKCKPFLCPDGAYSYSIECSSCTSQASHVSLGLKEGDVNATVINCTGIIFNSLRALELIPYKVDLFDHSGLEKFLAAAGF